MSRYWSSRHVGVGCDNVRCIAVMLFQYSTLYIHAQLLAQSPNV